MSVVSAPKKMFCGHNFRGKYNMPCKPGTIGGIERRLPPALDFTLEYLFYNYIVGAGLIIILKVLRIHLQIARCLPHAGFPVNARATLFQGSGEYLTSVSVAIPAQPVQLLRYAFPQ